ncbi:Translation initiation factor 3 [Macleaya cordata]|uniref:Translation initiation factor IF-3 n=1 Tax=Macleaya cordata TaxID=56857 RepID=A0A200QKN6_MACCD|nr:Translation initiation factor 3 [Macleaya cordata]
MAGITIPFPCKPLFSRRTTPPPLPFSLSSLESSITGVRLSYLKNFPKIDSICSVCCTSQSTITARFGGYRPPPRPNQGRPREKRQTEVEADPSLDISSVRSASVRLIDANQNMIGVVSKSEAIQMAEAAELDLVILSPDADPPVLRIMDYNKYRYEQQKKKREQQKKSAATRMDIKELKMGYNIDIHDYSVRLRAAEKFLKEGNKVKIIVNLKGRENEFKNIAIELIKRFQNDIGELATEESRSFRERNMFIVLIPNKVILQKAQEQPKKKEKPAVTEISASV